MNKKLSIFDINHNFAENRTGFYILLFFAVILIFNDISVPGLTSFDDCYYAQKGWEMLNGSGFLTPHYMGNEDFINPPLFFWMIALSFTIFGKTAFAAKFFTALCGFVTIIFTYKIGETSGSRKLGWWAAAFLSTSYVFLKSSRRAMMDVPFACFSTIALYFFIKAYITHQNRTKDTKADKKQILLNLLFYALFAGLAGLIKTVFIAWVIGIPFLFLIIKRDFKPDFFVPVIFANITSLLVTGWWFVYELKTYGERFVNGFYGKMLSGHIHGTEQMGSGFLGYVVEFGRFFWLWLPVTLWALYFLARKRPFKKNPVQLLILLQGLLPVILLSFTGNKSIRYVLYTFPPLVILTAFALTLQFNEDTLQKLSRYMLVFLLILTSFLIIRPMDTDNIKNIDYIQMGKMYEDGTLKTGKLDIYHYKGEFWINQNPLYYYAHKKLGAIINSPEDFNTLPVKGEKFLVLVKKEDIQDLPEKDFRIRADLKTRMLLQSRFKAGEKQEK